MKKRDCLSTVTTRFTFRMSDSVKSTTGSTYYDFFIFILLVTDYNLYIDVNVGCR
jgi:hypothetical protein